MITQGPVSSPITTNRTTTATTIGSYPNTRKKKKKKLARYVFIGLFKSFAGCMCYSGECNGGMCQVVVRPKNECIFNKDYYLIVVHKIQTGNLFFFYGSIDVSINCNCMNRVYNETCAALPIQVGICVTLLVGKNMLGCITPDGFSTTRAFYYTTKKKNT